MPWYVARTNTFIWESVSYITGKYFVEIKRSFTSYEISTFFLCFVVLYHKFLLGQLGLHIFSKTLLWRHHGLDGVSNHQPHECLLDRSFRRRSKKTSMLRATGLCAENSPETGEFPAQMASNAENAHIDDVIMDALLAVYRSQMGMIASAAEMMLKDMNNMEAAAVLKVIFKLVLWTDILRTFSEIVIRWMPPNSIGDNSTLFQVMPWCHQATAH